MKSSFLLSCALIAGNVYGASTPPSLTTTASAMAPEAVHSSKKEDDTKNVLMDFQNAFSAISEKTMPCVVNISTTQIVEKAAMPGFPFPGMGGGQGGPSDNPLEDLFRGFMGADADRPKRIQSLGSGFFIKVTDADAFIVTNYHVVAEAKKVTIIMHDKTEADATLHAFDERTDIAVLKIKLASLPTNKREIRALEWGSSDAIKPGHIVLSIGNPFGLGGTLTSGVISAKGRDIVLRNKNRATDFVDDFIQHDCAINMGNSGGVLLNIEGKVVGVNTAIFSPTGGSVGIGFAIPSDLVKKTVNQLLEHGRVKRGWLGVQIRPLDQEMAETLGLKDIRGGVVEGITESSPAGKAGIQERDIITAVNGKELNDTNRITRIIGETEVGKEITIKILRTNEKGEKIPMEIKATLGEFPSPSAATVTVKQDGSKTFHGKTAEILGMTVAEFKNTSPDPEAKKHGPQSGLVILDVKENSSAEDSALRKGDILTEINVVKITNPEDALKKVEEAKKDGREGVTLTVFRPGTTLSQFVVVKFKTLADSSVTEQKPVQKEESTVPVAPVK